MIALRRVLLALVVFILIFTIVYSPVSGQITGNKAKLNGIYFDNGYQLDAGNYGLYEVIAIKVGISVFSSGNYTLRGSLCNSNGSEVIIATNQSYLDNKNSFIRNTYMVLKFYYKAEVNGPRYLRNLALYDSSGNLVDQVGNAYSTKSYTHLDYTHMPTEHTQTVQPNNLSGYYKNYGVDTNGDGLYDFLIIEVGVNVPTPGGYTLDGSLYDSNGTEIGWSLDHENLSAGTHIMKLNFDGKAIARHKINGPYSLGNLELYTGSFETGYIPYIIDFEGYDTSAYKYTDFVNL